MERRISLGEAVVKTTHAFQRFNEAWRRGSKEHQRRREMNRARNRATAARHTKP